jgi:hypothetical protein
MSATPKGRVQYREIHLIVTVKSRDPLRIKG